MLGHCDYEFVLYFSQKTGKGYFENSFLFFNFGKYATIKKWSYGFDFSNHDFQIFLDFKVKERLFLCHCYEKWKKNVSRIKGCLDVSDLWRILQNSLADFGKLSNMKFLESVEIFITIHHLESNGFFSKL